MNITDFFEHSLGAKLKNSRWSWGAVNEKQGRLFLRVWSDQYDDTKKKGLIPQMDCHWSPRSTRFLTTGTSALTIRERCWFPRS